MRGLRRFLVEFMIILVANLGCIYAQEKLSAEAMLEDFVRDYIANDSVPESPLQFGIKISGAGGGEWTVKIDGPEKVFLERGLPAKPSWFVISDLETLTRVYQGDLNALTGIVRASDEDKTPMDVQFQEGYKATDDDIRIIIPQVYFHFFTRGKPEIVLFGESYSRLVHGANNVLIYGEKGLRLSWYQIKKGLAINRNSEHTNPFPSFFIFIKGKGKARIGDKFLDVKEGMAVLVPAGTVHQIWTEGDDVLEMVLVMFGKGA